ncbi:helix-turn-helix domain-containing protein [Oribacterium sp. oral taxon 078]|uniref:helix-turn-helix domain-containing protein n=1 Tax=Oribacterium sp. oral taxon 078 TaxID=652706 RepID=UPI0009DBD970
MSIDKDRIWTISSAKFVLFLGAHTGDVVQRIVAAHGGNRAAFARQLGISRTTLWRYLGKLESSDSSEQS